MTTVQIEKDKLVKAYNNGDSKVKTVLTDIFGAETFTLIPSDIIERFEKACREQKLSSCQILHSGDLCMEQQVANAYTMLRVLAISKRGKWTPNYSNSNQKKWYLWFKWETGSFVVFGAGYYCTRTITFVGSRLCFPDEATALEFAEENLYLYNIILSN